MIFGESGGGAKVCTLLAMPAAKGLITGPPIQSGSWLRGMPSDEATSTAKAVLSELGISASNIDELQRVPVQRLLSLKTGAMVPLPPRRGALRMGFSPVVDGKILPQHPFDPVATPVSADIPLLVGCTREEATLFYLRDESVFSLDEAGLRARVLEMMEEPEASRLIETYKKANPGASPSEIFLLIASDRLARRELPSGWPSARSRRAGVRCTCISSRGSLPRCTVGCVRPTRSRYHSSSTTPRFRP